MSRSTRAGSKARSSTSVAARPQRRHQHGQATGEGQRERQQQAVVEVDAALQGPAQRRVVPAAWVRTAPFGSPVVPLV